MALHGDEGVKEKVVAYELHRIYGEEDSLIDFITASERTRSMTMLITNDKFVSVEHRVLANGGKEPRTSVASFFVHLLKSFCLKKTLPSTGKPLQKPLTTMWLENVMGTIR
ncbi:hypothetical protein YC2023_034854 [Brassica napus]